MTLRRLRTLALSCIAWCSLAQPAAADRVAVIGGGGSGLTSAWLIESMHDVTVYEHLDRLGGHADSVDLMVDGKKVTVEAGFEFFSKSLHPTFLKLLQQLKVQVHPFTLVSTWYNTNGHDVLILPPYHNGAIEWDSVDVTDLDRMVQFKKILDEGKILIDSGEACMTLKTFVDTVDVSEAFKEQFLYPYIASGWGIEPDKIKGYSAYNTLKYIVYGQEDNTYQWLEVVGGTAKYIAALANSFTNTTVKLHSRIAHITYDGGVYTITEANGSQQQYDQLIMAVHADDAGNLLREIPEAQDMATMLRNVKYIDTLIGLHGDKRFMPPHERDWRVANVRYDGKNSALTAYKQRPGLPNVFKSWLTLDVRAANDKGSPMPDPLYALAIYRHAVTDLDYYHVQRAAQMVQGNRGLWYVGAWTWDNDSHESAVVSAVNVAKRLAPNSPRLPLLAP